MSWTWPFDLRNKLQMALDLDNEDYERERILEEMMITRLRNLLFNMMFFANFRKFCWGLNLIYYFLLLIIGVAQKDTLVV